VRQARCAVGFIQEGLVGLNVSWGKEERVFVGHIVKIHAFFVP